MRHRQENASGPADHSAPGPRAASFALLPVTFVAESETEAAETAVARAVETWCATTTTHDALPSAAEGPSRAPEAAACPTRADPAHALPVDAAQAPAIRRRHAP